MASSKIKVGLVFGGKSGEHEVSLQSAKSIYEALDKSKYDVLLIGVDKLGSWHLGEGSQFLLNSHDPKLISLNNAAPEITAITTKQSAQLVNLQTQQPLTSVDVFFPIIHGTYGEDGSLQGLFELLNTAYVGANVLGSAVGMDKAIMKRLLLSVGLPVPAFVALKQHLISSSTLDRAAQQLGFPLFVKPANSGSSVGVQKVKTRPELQPAVDDALQYDSKILLEAAVEGREIECSVLGNDEPRASVPGEVRPTHEFYSYNAKYIDEHGAELIIPADLPPEITTRIQQLAVDTFRALDCSGMARVDFFLQPDGQVFINEINTLPGFTKISMYPKLWEASGISYPDLLDRLIQLAMERKQQQDKLLRSYQA